MIDAILSYHLNPETCGVAKFNQQLAKRLGVPFGSVYDAHRFQHPLLSLKCEEWERGELTQLIEAAIAPPAIDVLWHGSILSHITDYATNVYTASDVGCPNLVEGDASRGEIHVVTLGMAHKIHLAPYEKLKQLLDAARRPYTIGVTTAVHERAPWDGIGVVAEQMRAVFGPRVRSLGYLGDDALVREFYDASAVAVFFDPAARANNTTLWTALTYGQTVITNLDADSPPELIHGETVWNLDDLQEWPEDASERRVMRAKARTVLDRYSWRSVIEALTKVEVSA